MHMLVQSVGANCTSKSAPCRLHLLVQAPASALGIECAPSGAICTLHQQVQSAGEPATANNNKCRNAPTGCTNNCLRRNVWDTNCFNFRYYRFIMVDNCFKVSNYNILNWMNMQKARDLIRLISKKNLKITQSENDMDE